MPIDLLSGSRHIVSPPPCYIQGIDFRGGPYSVQFSSNTVWWDKEHKDRLFIALLNPTYQIPDPTQSNANNGWTHPYPSLI